MQATDDADDAERAPCFRLRWGEREYELLPGELLLGRGSECHVSFDDQLVSRRHARLVVSGRMVTLEDLASANGVFVNGERLTELRMLEAGDRILIGQQELTLVQADRDSFAESFDRATLVNHMPEGLGDLPPPPHTEATSRVDAFVLLCSVAEKVLSIGRAADAERMLSKHLEQVLESAARSRTLSDQTAELAARFALKFAAATGNGEWIDYLVQLYSTLRRPMPGALVDELHGVVRGVSGVDLELLRSYVAQMRSASARFKPAERFAIQRLEGIERVVSSR